MLFLPWAQLPLWDVGAFQARKSGALGVCFSHQQVGTGSGDGAENQGARKKGESVVSST